MIGCRLDTIAIPPAVEAFDAMLSDSFADKGVDLTEENIQSRIRGVTLMALSNKFGRSEEHTSELQSLMRISYAVFCLQKKNKQKQRHNRTHTVTKKHTQQHDI